MSEQKNNAVIGLVVLFLAISAALVYGWVQDNKELSKQLVDKQLELNEYKNVKTNLQNDLNDANKALTALKTEVKDLDAELVKKSQQVLIVNGASSNNANETRQRIRNAAAKEFEDAFTEFKHDVQRCYDKYDNDESRFEDCVDDKFDDLKDERVRGIMNLA